MSMAFPGKDWESASPRSQEVDPDRLSAALRYLAANTGENGTKETLLLRNGRLIWRGPEIGKVHGVWSATKSFTSTVLGLLIDDGKCRLETLARDHVPALADAYPGVTLRHFTTMTSGYRAVGDEPKGTYLHGPSNTPFRPHPEPLFRPPGSQFAYWDSALSQFANVLTQIAEEPLKDLFRRRIADPVGMDPAVWNWGDFGRVGGRIVNCGSGGQDQYVTISARELARLGHLFLNEGVWDGRRLLGAEWVRQATKVQVPPTLPWAQPASGIDGRGVYGYSWWINGTGAKGRRKWPSAPGGTFAASGFNNNKCFVIPEWGMVIVRLGLDGNVADEVWDGFFARLAPGVEGCGGARPVGGTRPGAPD